MAFNEEYECAGKCVCVGYMLKQMTDELVGGLTAVELWNCCKSFRSLAVCKLWFPRTACG